MGSIHVRPATEADAAAIAAIHYATLERYHEFYACFFAVHPRESLPQNTRDMLKRPNHGIHVAIEEASGSSPAVVGFVRYATVEPTTSPTKTAEKEQEEQEQDVKPPSSNVPALFAPKKHMAELWDRFNEREAEMEKCCEEATKGEKHAYVNHLMVDPAHQRRGIGRRLMEAMVLKSDAEGLSVVVIEVSELAHGMYLDLGFEDLNTWVIDNGYWAGVIAKYEKGLGVSGNEDLAERFEGVEEVQRYMIRRVKKEVV